VAFTLNGFGTTFYGESNHHPDGSYQTTKWFVVAFFPLVPLESLRVTRNPVADVNLILYQAEGFNVIQKVPVEPKQVFFTYLFATLYVAWVVAVGWYFLGIFDKMDTKQVPALVQWMYIGTAGLALWLPFFALFGWRRASRAAAIRG